MNRSIVRGLFQDALYQVLDNLGFRILGVLFTLPVLLSFVIGFRDDGIWFLHYWSWSYTDMLQGFGANAADPAASAALAGVREMLLDRIVSLVVDWVADKFGFVFGIAAISFFVPQMLERGAADVVFSKPVSRPALFLSRYVAGLIFVGLLSGLLVGGMSLGFAVTSGYRDSGLLWSVLTLMYGFAIFHAISCTIGVFTRNTIAAILLTLVFMPINCAMHAGWEQMAVSDHEEQEFRASKEQPEPKEEPGAMIGLLRSGLTTYHVLAPKSRDAVRIARKWRKSIEDREPEFEDLDLGLSVLEAPRGFKREPRSSFKGDGLLWIAAHPDGAGEARWTLRSEPMSAVGSRSSVTKRLRKELGVEPTRSDISTRYTDRFDWSEARGDEQRTRRRWVFQVGSELLTLDYDAEQGWAAGDEAENSVQAFVASIQVKEELQRQADAGSYERYFAWGGPWQFNAWFSVLSTLAFVAAVLGLGIWKLRRIDF